MTDLRKAADRIQELTEALQNMVVAFGGGGVTESHSTRIQALNRACQILKVEPKALAQPEQEPYGYFRYDIQLDAWVQNREDTKGIAFYTALPKREWVGLTDEQIFEHEWWDEETAFAVNKELKEKNGG